MKEPSLINISEKVIKKQRLILIIATILVVTLFIGSSYSLLTSSSETEEVITVTSGELKAELQNIELTTLNGELPKSDEEGLNNNSIEINIKNTGTLTIGKYDVQLIKDTTKESTLDEQYIRYAISLDGKVYKSINTLSETKNIIYTGYNLEKEKTIKIYLKLWLKEDAGEEILSKSYYGSINVELYQNGGKIVEVVKDKLVPYSLSSASDFKGGVVGVNTKGELYNENNQEEIREYRYSGPNVNNYVTFNDELWRIIGVFTDENNIEHVKIVRNDVIKQEDFPATFETNNIVYDIKSTNTDGEYAFWNKRASGFNNNWATAGLQYWLNDGKDVETKSPNAGYMSYLSKNSKDMIEDKTKYYLGTVTYYNRDMNGGSESVWGVKDTVNEAYKNERAVTGCEEGKGPAENSSRDTLQSNATCRVWPNNQAIWEGSIALLYPSDYGYSADSKYWNIKLGYTTFNVTASDSSWLQKTTNHKSHEWLLALSSGSAYGVATWAIAGYASDSHVTNDSFSVRPTLYLKNNIKIVSGTGEENNPYILDF